MASSSPKIIARKSDRRTQIVNEIMAGLKSDVVFNIIDYKNKPESYIKQFMHQPLVGKLEEIFKWLSPSVSADRCRAKAREALLWEGDVNATINNILFLGVQHRPDFVVQIDGLRIAVEVKRGETGSAVREGIGQCLVYATEFDFVTYLFVDVSRDNKVKRAMGGPREQFLVRSLWDHYNILFDAV